VGNIGACHLKNRIIMPLYPTKYASEGKINPKMVEFYRARESRRSFKKRNKNSLEDLKIIAEIVLY